MRIIIKIALTAIFLSICFAPLSAQKDKTEKQKEKQPSKVLENIEDSGGTHYSDTIVWDFANQTSDQIQGPCCFKKDANVRLLIKNINRSVYDITIDKELKSYHTTVPDVLDINKMSEDLNKTIAASSDADKAVVAANHIAVLDTTKTLISEQTTACIRDFKTGIQQLQNGLSCASCLHSILNSNVGHTEAIQKRNECISNNLDGLLDRAALGKYLHDALNQVIEEYQSIPSAKSTDPVDYQVQITRIKSTYNTLINSNKPQDVIRDIFKVYDLVSDPQNYTFFTTFPINAGSKLNLNIKTTPKPDSKLHVEEITQSYNIKGIKISFSPGLFVNHFPGSRNYYLEDHKVNGQMTDSVLIKSTFDDKSLIPSVGALAHVSFFGCNDYDFAISAGVSARLETGSVRWHLGTSLLLGKERRFVLSVGATIGQGISELNQSFKLKTPYAKSFINDQTITSPTTHIGWFFGFSYNIPIKAKS